MTIDLRREAESFREWLDQQVSTTSVLLTDRQERKSVAGIVALYCYVQSGWIALDFNTDVEFEFNGDVSPGAWENLFDRPTWQAFAESEGKTAMTFIETDGSTQSMPASEMTDEFLSGHFGQMIAGVLSSAWRDGVFSSLPIKPGCVISVNDFYGNWGWEAKEVSGALAIVEQ